MRFRLFYLWLTKKKKITLTSILLKILLIGELRIGYVTGSKYFWILVLIPVFNWDLKVIEDTKISCVPGNCPGSSWKHLLSCRPLADHCRTTALSGVLLSSVLGKSGLCDLLCDKLRHWYEGYKKLLLSPDPVMGTYVVSAFRRVSHKWKIYFRRIFRWLKHAKYLK